MGEWYSLEGLAARLALPESPISVLQAGFKRAFGKVAGEENKVPID